MSNKSLKIHQSISLLLLLTVMVTIFYLSSQDATDSAEVSGSVVSWLHEFLQIDLPDGTIRTIAHCCEFGTLGFLMLSSFRSFRRNLNPAIPVAVSFAYAVTDEVHQLFVPGRAFQIIDLVVDLTGIVLGTIAFLLLKLIINKKGKSQ